MLNMLNDAPKENRLAGKIVFVLSSFCVLSTIEMDRRGTDAAPAQPAEAADWRDIANGQAVPTPGMRYVDQPYLAKLKDGAWLCLITVGPQSEGKPENHTAALVSRDRGRTWSAPVKVCRAYAVPLVTPAGRAFALTPQSLAWSDDGGKTWSEPRALNVDAEALKRVGKGAAGGYEGSLGWSVSLPLVAHEAAYMAWARVGLGRPPRRTDVYLLRGANALTEHDPAKIVWQFLPDAEEGIRGPDWQKPEHRSEEPHVVQLGDGTLYIVFRTDQGHIGHSTSRDGGKTWSKAVRLAYPDGRTIKNPLACPSLWKCSNGKYLLWFHNHSGPKDFRKNAGLPYADRNPAWVCGGVERKGGGAIDWSEPEVLLYGSDLSYDAGRISYPGFIEDDGRYFLFETQKTRARMHEAPAGFLDALWAQAQGQPRPPASRPVLSWRSGDAAPAMPRLPAPGRNGAGFALDLWFEVAAAAGAEPRRLIDSREASGAGFAVTLDGKGSLRLDLGDGKNRRGWDMPLKSPAAPGKPHHATFIADGGPGVVWCVFDGAFCDGGDARQFGWGRLDVADPGVGTRNGAIRRDPPLGDVSGAPQLTIAGADGAAPVKLLRVTIYDRPLSTSEAVASFLRGPAVELR
jgi:hypothetical protein